jgi:hypothetical protein
MTENFVADALAEARKLVSYEGWREDQLKTVRLRQGTIVSYSSGTKLATIRLGGDTTDITNVKHIGSYTPNAADTGVLVLMFGTYPILIGAIGAATGNSASSVTFSPTGNVSSTNVQSAIAEVDGEKSDISHTHTVTGIEIQQASDNTSRTTTSTTYVDTTLLQITETLTAGQSMLIIIESQSSVSAEGATAAMMSVEVSGPGTSDLATSDDNATENGNIRWTPGCRHVLFTATEGGTHFVTMKHRVIGAITGSWHRRRLTTMKLPL